jgi:hypothetical protein
MCIYICVYVYFLGHALISLKTEGADPIHKATIMPRGRALGKIHIRYNSYNTIQCSILNIYLFIYECVYCM